MTAVLAFLLSDAGQTLLIGAGGLLFAWLRKTDKRAATALVYFEKAYTFVEGLGLKGSNAKLEKYLAVLAGMVRAATGKSMTDAERRAAVEFVKHRAAAEKRLE